MKPEPRHKTESKHLWPLNTVAAMLSISRETLYRLIRQGRFPEPIKQGRRSFFTPSDVETYLGELKRLHG